MNLEGQIRKANTERKCAVGKGKCKWVQCEHF